MNQWVCSGLVVVLASSYASGQLDPERAAWRFDRPVDAGYDDVGPLTASLRLERFELRIPDEWDQVYRLEGIDGDLFARRSGGLTAVFDRSQYVNSPFGVMATIPAGTIFVIGEPAPWLLESLGLGEPDWFEDRRADNRVDLALDSRVSTRYIPTEEPPLDSVQFLNDARRDASIWYNDEIRQARVKRLLDRAQRESER